MKSLYSLHTSYSVRAVHMYTNPLHYKWKVQLLHKTKTPEDKYSELFTYPFSHDFMDGDLT